VTSNSWSQAVVESLKSQTATWFIGFLIALLTVFSSTITERIRTALNSADIRSKNYEDLASDMSEYMFESELTVEFIEHGWTTADSLKDYNESITKLRKKEWVYSSWIGRYWGERKAKEFAQCMDTVKTFDHNVHGLNDEIKAVVICKTKKKFDPAKSE